MVYVTYREECLNIRPMLKPIINGRPTLGYAEFLSENGKTFFRVKELQDVIVLLSYNVETSCSQLHKELTAIGSWSPWIEAIHICSHDVRGQIGNKLLPVCTDLSSFCRT